MKIGSAACVYMLLLSTGTIGMAIVRIRFPIDNLPVAVTQFDQPFLKKNDRCLHAFEARFGSEIIVEL